jgi:long-subunit fatty acid transport protein
MIRQVVLVVFTGLIVLVTGVGHDVQAAGIILYELGTPDVGRASAGWAARADDAATLFTNPAGMSRLPDHQLLLGGQLTYCSFGFKPNENTAVQGNDGGNPVGSLPGGSVFYTHKLPSGWSVGIGAFSYFGLAAEYEQGWVGRYYTQESTLLGFTLMPAASYRVKEHLSFGAGFNWMFGVLEQKSAIRNIVEQTDGTFKLSDNTQGFGANVGGVGGSKRRDPLRTHISFSGKAGLRGHAGVHGAGWCNGICFEECWSARRRGGPRHDGTADSHGQRLSRIVRQMGDHGQCRLAKLEQFRQG